MDTWHLFEAEIDGEWLVCMYVGGGSVELCQEQGGQIAAAFRERGIKYPLRIRQVGSQEEMMEQCDCRAQDYDEIHDAVKDYCEKLNKDIYPIGPEPSVN